MSGLELHADREVCIGSGNCVRVAEHVFDQDDDGRVRLIEGADPAAHADDVDLAVAGCPVGALWLGDG
jgi:ferredoxin